MRANTRTLSGLLGYHDDFVSLTGSARPERVYGALTSADYFEVLGVRPILGRSLLDTKANERAGAAEAVLGYNLWQNHFAGDPAIVGKTIQINLHPYTVVGVAPKGFIGCKSGLRTDIFLPLGMDNQVWDSGRIDHRDTSWLNVLGVLRPGVSQRDAENELNVLMAAPRYAVSERPPGSQPALAGSIVALSLRRQCLHGWNTAHAPGPRGGAAAAGLRQRGQPAAGALGGAAARICHPAFDGREPLDPGASDDDREHAARGRRGRQLRCRSRFGRRRPSPCSFPAVPCRWPSTAASIAG